MAITCFAETWRSHLGNASANRAFRRTPMSEDAKRLGSAQSSDMALEHGPGLGAEMILPTPVKIGQGRSEPRSVRGADHHAALFQRILKRGIERHIVGALELHIFSRIALDGCADIVRKLAPHREVGEEIITR